jgi:O-antigen biosynthesis protein
LKIIILEAGPVTPLQDAGSRAVLDFYSEFMELGYQTFLIDESKDDLNQSISRINPNFIVISRPGLCRRFLNSFGDIDLGLVYMAHDLHYLRLGLQINLLEEKSSIINKRNLMFQIEKYCVQKTTLSLFPTTTEAELANYEFKVDKAKSINYFSFSKSKIKTHIEESLKLIFVGGESHKPNADGLRWFLDNIWENLQALQPFIKLSIVGLWSDTFKNSLDYKGVLFKGVLSESQLADEMLQSNVGIAPLRFGAGMKRKTLNYLSHGLPTISTSFGVQGLKDSQFDQYGVIVANGYDEWIKGIIALSSKELRRKLGKAGNEFIEKSFSREIQRSELEKIAQRFQ